MTRDEFLYLSLKDNASMYRGLSIVYALAAIAAFIMAVCAIILKRDVFAALAVLAMGAGFVVACLSSRDTCKSYIDALEEIGDDPTGVNTCRTYSVKTAQLIASARLSAKELFGAIFAYGIIALSLLAGGIILFAISDSSAVFAALGALLVFGSFLLGILSYRSFRSWRAAKELEALGQ